METISLYTWNSGGGKPRTLMKKVKEERGSVEKVALTHVALEICLKPCMYHCALQGTCDVF